MVGVVVSGANEGTGVGEICGAFVGRMQSVVIYETTPVSGFVVCEQEADENCCSPDFGPLHFFPIHSYTV